MPQVPLPEASLTLRVVDENDRPVVGAKAGIRAQDTVESMRRSGSTDEKGEFFDRVPSFGYLYYSTGMSGFYSAWGEFRFEKGAMSGESRGWAEQRWSPWNPTVQVALKRKGQPIAMYATRIYLVPPVSDRTPVGFDLEVGDWLAPHGRGKQADMFFSVIGTVENSDLVLTWSFPNKGDGIIVNPYEGGARSELRSPTQAPEEGYLPDITVDAEGRPKSQTGDYRPLSFVFRVRTVLDDAGKVVTANYGKIYPEAFKAVFYFNPTPNSRVLEYNPKQNLRAGVKSYERVNEP